MERPQKEDLRLHPQEHFHPLQHVQHLLCYKFYDSDNKQNTPVDDPMPDGLSPAHKQQRTHRRPLSTTNLHTGTNGEQQIFDAVFECALTVLPSALHAHGFLDKP